MECTVIYNFEEIERDDNAEIISQNTANTWQPDRRSGEILANTEQGKIAENAVIKYIQENSSNIVYLSYDEFRSDNFEKHAPFDGLIFNKEKVSETTKNTFIEKINAFISQNPYGKISSALRKEMEDNFIYTVEIKSTKVNDKKHNASGISSYDKIEEVQLLINEILNDDFLTYPLYIRSGNMSWFEYCEYAKTRILSFNELQGETLYVAVKNLELSCMATFYIRVYIDYKFSKILIMGFINKEELLNPPFIKKMVQPGKSEMALYFAKNLNNRKKIKDLLKTLN